MIHLILLAAGHSRRFGADKLLSEMDAKPMYRHILDRLLSLSERHGWPVTLVTREGELAGQAEKLPLRLLLNPDSEQGISTSIRCALRNLADGAPAAFFVADQPYLREETIERFLQGYLASNKGLGCVTHEGDTGNPVAFSAQYYDELRSLTGDRGGKRVLLRHTDDCFFFEVDDAQELFDVDTPQAKLP